jgi:hypothetical protein
VWSSVRHATRAASAPPARQEDNVEAYCVKCREQRALTAPRQITMRNGKPMVQGTCPVCGTTLTKMGASLAAS